MRERKVFKRMAAALTVVMLSLPAMSAAADTGLPELKTEFVTRNITDLSGGGVQTGSDDFIPDEDAELETDRDEEPGQGTVPVEDLDSETDDSEIEEDILLPGYSRAASHVRSRGIEFASTSSARVEYTIDGESKEAVTFDIKRDLYTNRAVMPEPVILKFEQTAGEKDFGHIDISVGVPGNPADGLNTDGITRIRIEPAAGGDLKAGESLEFKVYFVNKNVANESINNNAELHFLRASGGGKTADIPVYYGVDGPYSYYSVEAPDQYEGTPFTDSETGNQYKLIGHVKLNEEDPQTFTIRHQFGVYADMTGTDAQGNPVSLQVVGLKLNPDGNFTFTDGSYEQIPRMNEDGVITISLKFKDEVFRRIKREAVKDKKMLLRYVILADLVMEYNDGYLAGGNMSPLPLVYAVSYIPEDNRPVVGGGGGGGGGSSSGSSTGVSGSVVGPGMAPRVTNASADDIGWVQKDGSWYYMNAAGTPVTDWLLGPDGRWYFLDAGGVMKTGWLSIGGKWYFLNGDGAMAVGWVQGADRKWYYLQQDGSMAVSTTTSDGYAVDQDGVWQAV